MIDFLLKKGEFILKNAFLMMKIYEWKKKFLAFYTLLSDTALSIYGECQSHREVGTEFSLFFPQKNCEDCEKSLINCTL